MKAKKKITINWNIPTVNSIFFIGNLSEKVPENAANNIKGSWLTANERMVNDTDSVSEINIHPTAILSVHNASEKKVDEIIIFLKSEILRDDEIFIYISCIILWILFWIIWNIEYSEFLFL